MPNSISIPERAYAPGGYGPFNVTVPAGTKMFRVQLVSSTGVWPTGDAANPIFVLTWGFDGYTPAAFTVERVGIDRTTGLPYKTLTYELSAPTDGNGNALLVTTASASVQVNVAITCAVQAAALS